MARRARAGTRAAAIEPGWARAWVSATSRCARSRSERVGGKRGVAAACRRGCPASAGTCRRSRRKPIEPDSPPTLVETVAAEQLQRVRERLAVARLGALAHHGRRQRSDAAPVGFLELIGAAEERDREGHERQIVLFGDDELGAVRQAGARPRGHAQHRRLPGGGTCVRSSACCATTGSGSQKRQQRCEDGAPAELTTRPHCPTSRCGVRIAVTFRLSSGFAA